MMKSISISLIVLFTLSFLTRADQEFILNPSANSENSQHWPVERRLSAEGRELAHMHMQSTPLYGNSTDLMYYYVTVYFGSHRQAQTLIVDTGSSVACVPCKEYCIGSSNCGKHINSLYETSQSNAFFAFDCNKVDC